MISGFSAEQLNDFMALFQGMLITELDRRFDKAPPLPIIESLEPSHTPDASPCTSKRQLRAEEVRYFDPEYQSE